uniref:Retinoblastoma-like 1 (p107) n=1 Tax=Scleropages formosus TaxID=113540 RepID=A0A8C9VJR1_SCLFO
MDSQSGNAADSTAREIMETLCQELNMDEDTADEAMQNFTAIWNTYTLEGEVIHWLACALYAACRKGSTPTVGKGVMEGNCVSLTRILRCSKLSLIQFFCKMKKWSDMSNLSQDFRERIGRLERNFEVTTVIFRKFEPIFMSMFQNPQGERPRQPRSRKHKRLPCHISDVFKFCWTLFVYTKGNFRMIGDDLVNSYHLLLCCLDLVFANALLCANRRDLINPSFKDLPCLKDEAFLSPDYTPPEQPPCIVDKLCELHDGLVVEAKGIKEHYFKPYIKKLFERQILKGNEETLTELLDTPNFIDNNKAVNREYEEYVLTVGDFDERVFLGADADEEIGTPRKAAVEIPEGQLSARMQVECNLQQHVEKAHSFAPSTPLTGRRYLKEKEVLVTPVSSATQSVSRLQSMVSGLRNAPSEALLQIFKSCSRDPTETVLERVKCMGETFRQQYTKHTEELSGSHMDFILNTFSGCIFCLRSCCLLLQVLLEQDIFHRSLLACCLEVVLFAYSSQHTFPWIIDIFKLPPFYFYKVIEVFIRSEEGLSRDMVKHLNSIEEQVLECRAWSHDSALWEALEAAHNKVPTVEEVNFPGSFETGNGNSGPVHLPLVAVSPIVHPRLREVRTGLDVPPSPISLHDRYSSPTAGSAKRRLFGDDLPPKSPPKKTTFSHGGIIKIIPTSPRSSGHEGTPQSPLRTVITVGTSNVSSTNGPQLSIPVQGVKSEIGGITFVQVQGSDASPLTAQVLLTASPSRPTPNGSTAADLQNAYKPRRTGSLALFFRKVYHLASVRLRDLCLKLDISPEQRAKIWTCFEHSIVHCTDLMKDRHLDQLLLCAVYVVSKITKEERTFQDIMKCYRSQPQANSHVYRSVLLRRRTREQASDENSMEEASGCEGGKLRVWDRVPLGVPCDKLASHPGCVPSSAALSQDNAELVEDRSDLIQFYNSIYVLKMKSFALKYAVPSIDHRAEAPPLSPFPSMRAQPLSPRRISQRHSIYVSPHKNGTCLTPSSAFTYRFNGSPSKELTDINRMIKQGGVSRKRAFTMEGDCSESPSKRVCQESEDVLLKRLQDVVSERAHH